MSRLIDEGQLDPFTLRFEDSALETSFQQEEGQLGIAGYRIITGATALLWAVAAVLIPLGTDIPPGMSWRVGGIMALVGLASLAVSPWARTMNRQHALASLLTSANGLVILVLASAGDVVAGFAVAGIMLLYMFGFVSRTRFVYALVRTVVIAIGFGLVWATYEGQGSLIMDAFFLVAASAGSLVGLRLLERDRRRVWHQRLVIEEQSAAIEVERSESERLLLNVLPAAVSKRLREGENPIADDFPNVTVLFADIVGFTAMTSTMSADEVITLLSGLFNMFDDLVTERGLEKIKTIGDAYLAVGGLPDPIPDHARRVVDLAVAMQACSGAVEHFPGLTVRIGVHSGPVAGGVIGTRKFAYDVWGTTVNTAARLQSTGVPGRVHVSEATRNLTGRAFEYEPRGAVELRGIGSMTTYLVSGPSNEMHRDDRVATTPA
ncbi:MAG: adenylate/guanylate cyclase domain-containing protein [Acidimicrobiia bacterium]|jgi:class 3 adenylate cyclase